MVSDLIENQCLRGVPAVRMCWSRTLLLPLLIRALVCAAASAIPLQKDNVSLFILINYALLFYMI